jgi:formate dehydrogenase subunit gamma
MRQGTTAANLEDTIRGIVAQHARERGPLIVILHAIQERLGHVPAAAIPTLASALNLSRADVHGVVTFYRDFRSQPGGNVTLRVCRAEACAAVGAETLLSSLSDVLGIAVGETTADGSTTLDEVFCLGNCALGPSAQLNGRVHGRVTQDRALALIAGSPR